MSVAYKLKIQINETWSSEHAEKQIYGLLADLYHNGQINYDYFLVNKSGDYFAYVTCLEEDALDFCNCSVCGKDKRKDIYITSELLGENVENQEICHCQKQDGYILSYVDTINGSPIRCKKCDREIPLYHLPTIDSQDDFFTLMKWKEVCASLDCLWKHTTMDKFVENQFKDKTSDFWQFTEGIRGDLEKRWGKTIEVELPKI